MTNEALIDQAVGRSVQTPNPEYYGAMITSGHWVGSYELSLPPLDNPVRQAILRRVGTHPQSSMWMSSASGLITQIQSTPWKLTGKRRVNHYQDILMSAEYGDGWDVFIQKLIWDFLNNDDGAFIQVIGRGAVDRPLAREAVLGLSVLSPEFCWPTGNPDYPIWYQDANTGQLYKLHRTRVIRLVDKPQSDPRLRGRGICALSRAMTYVQQAIVTASYIGGQLSNQPPPGIALWNGAQAEVVGKMWSAYNTGRDQRLNDGVYRPAAEYINQANDVEVSLQWISFASAPAGFDPKEAEAIQASGIARALGIDVQDVQALSTGQFGTGMQSLILKEKAEGKTFGSLLKLLEREINKRVVPDNLRFEFISRDTEKSKEAADVTRTHLEVAQMLAALPGVPETAVMQYLATNDAVLADVLTDADGRLITAHDDDPDEPNPDGLVVTDLDADPMGPDPDSGDTTPIVEIDQKAFDEVGDPFQSRFFDVVKSANDGGLTSRQLDTAMRSTLRQFGQRAVLKGLQDGGVDVTSLDGDDFKAYQDWYKRTSKYVTEYVSRTFGYGSGLISRSDAAVVNTARMWSRKSIKEAYQIGLASADANGMYRWTLGATEEHCKDCLRFNGQQHRMKLWVKAGAVPGASKLKCKGFNCDCKFRPARGRSRGRIVW